MEKILEGKTVLLGVTGSIAAYKSATLASMLIKLGATVHVIMTKNAEKFISPITFETLTGNRCIDDTFDRESGIHVAHIALAKAADIFMIAPASANIIGKLANGIADDMLTSTFLACTSKVYVAPAMNTNMYDNIAVRKNIERLKENGVNVIEPAKGYLACGDTGRGKMPEPEDLVTYIVKEIAFTKDYMGKKVLVTAGPTSEAIDPVRYITNHSSGKMGYAIAKAFVLRGAEVTFVTGAHTINSEYEYMKKFFRVINVISTDDMATAVEVESQTSDIVVMSAAVADYRPKTVHKSKIKKSEDGIKLELTRTTDILSWIAENRKECYVCGFSMETENLIENSRKKLIKKNLDMIVANNLNVEGAGFKNDTNVITIITEEDVVERPLMSKDEAAHEILDAIKKEMSH